MPSVFAGGFYIFLAAYHDALPMFGRERPIDHSTKYSLGLDHVNLDFTVWTDESPEPGRYDAQVDLVFLNGTQDRFCGFIWRQWM